ELVVALGAGVLGEGGAPGTFHGGEVAGGLLEEVDDAAAVAVLEGTEAHGAAGLVGVPGDDVTSPDAPSGRGDAEGIGGLTDAALIVHDADGHGLFVVGLDNRALCLVLL